MENFETELENLNNVPAEFHGFYKKEGDVFKLDAENPIVSGAVKGIMGLNKALKAARNDAKSAKGKAVDISALSEFGQTPEEIKAAFETKISELQDAANSGDKKARLDLDKIKKEFAEQKAKELAERDTANQSLRTQLYDMLVVNEANSAITASKGNPKLLMPFIKQQVKVQEEDGKQVVVVVDDEGSIRMNGATQLPMTVSELIADMKSQKDFAAAFESEMKSGGGTATPARNTPGRQQAPVVNSVGKIAQGLSQGLHKAY